MLFADLHIHSTYSDGDLAPDEILEVAKLKGLRYISITDHDTILSQFQLEKYFSVSNPLIVPGLEISTEYEGYELHILAYFIDIHNIKLIKILEEVQEARLLRVRDIITELNRMNIDISTDDIELHKYISIGRPHIARVLVQKGYANNIKDAFHQFLGKGKSAYVERYKIKYKDALRLIAEAGGISVLAHPGEIYKGLNLLRLLKELKVYGLKGIEVFHPSHNSAEISHYYNLAKKLGLLISGGSDFHSLDEKGDSSIGLIGLNDSLMDKLVKHNIKSNGGMQWCYIQKR